MERVLRTGYYIDDFQASYFVVDSFEKLFEATMKTDFTPLYSAYRDMPEFTPFEILERDTVIRKGTGAYWKDFPQTKAKLK
jgi:phenylalanine-4-hydroxylase